MASGLVALAGCSHSSKHASSQDEQSIHPQVSVYQVHKFVPYTLRVRRPAVAGANPKAGPGGSDYRTEPSSDPHYGCHEISWLFRELKLSELRACWATDKASRALYIVKRLPVPYLELEDSDEAPPCLKKALPRIPLPREIFFQSTEDGRLACYSSRFEIEGNEIAGFKMPIANEGVRLEFPMTTVPKDDAEAALLLMSWAMTPFWTHSNTLLSHLVPDAICARCLGERSMVKPSDPMPPLWPTE